MSKFRVTRYKVHIKEELAAPKQQFSAVFLSDLHNTRYGHENAELLWAIHTAAPKAVFISGDMITSVVPPKVDAAIELLEKLAKQYSIYYVKGNHEYRAKKRPEIYGDTYKKYEDKIRSFGVHILEDQKEQIEIEKMPLTIWGLDLPEYCYNRIGSHGPGKEQIVSRLGEPDKGRFNLLLAHHPCYFKDYAAWGADLTLAGHLHGGIVRIPFLGGLVSPQMAVFPHYDKGYYQIGDKDMIVSAGLGTHTINLRINNPPELILLDFIK